MNFYLLPIYWTSSQPGQEQNPPVRKLLICFRIDSYLLKVWPVDEPGEEVVHLLVAAQVLSLVTHPPLQHSKKLWVSNIKAIYENCRGGCGKYHNTVLWYQLFLLHEKFLNIAVTKLILTWVLLDWLVEPFQIHQCLSFGVFSKGNTTKPFVLSGQYNRAFSRV